MLAGRMRLRTFLLIAGGVVVIGLAAIVAYLPDDEPYPEEEDEKIEADMPLGEASRLERKSSPPAPATSVPLARGPATSVPLGMTPDAPAFPDTGRDVDAVVFGWVGKDLGADKLKDVTEGRPYKVNVYQDPGHATMNRAKVDLDRDDLWDEKWTFDGEHISRRVAPADDESYTESYVWNGSAFVAE